MPSTTLKAPMVATTARKGKTRPASGLRNSTTAGTVVATQASSSLVQPPPPPPLLPATTATTQPAKIPAQATVSSRTSAKLGSKDRAVKLPSGNKKVPRIMSRDVADKVLSSARSFVSNILPYKRNPNVLPKLDQKPMLSEAEIPKADLVVWMEEYYSAWWTAIHLPAYVFVQHRDDHVMGGNMRENVVWYFDHLAQGLGFLCVQCRQEIQQAVNNLPGGSTQSLIDDPDPWALAKWVWCLHEDVNARRRQDSRVTVKRAPVPYELVHRMYTAEALPGHSKELLLHAWMRRRFGVDMQRDFLVDPSKRVKTNASIVEAIDVSVPTPPPPKGAKPSDRPLDYYYYLNRKFAKKLDADGRKVGYRNPWTLYRPHVSEAPLRMMCVPPRFAKLAAKVVFDMVAWGVSQRMALAHLASERSPGLTGALSEEAVILLFVLMLRAALLGAARTLVIKAIRTVKAEKNTEALNAAPNVADEAISSSSPSTSKDDGTVTA